MSKPHFTKKHHCPEIFISALIALTLSACSQAPLVALQDPVETNPSQADEAHFVQRAIAQAESGALIIMDAVKALSQTEKMALSESARVFLGSTENIAVNQLASRFTEPQALAFLEHYRRINPQLFLRPSLAKVSERLNQAFNASLPSVNANAPSGLRTNADLISDPELLKAMNELKALNATPQQTVTAAGDIYRIRANTKEANSPGALVGAQPFCRQVSHFSAKGRSKTLDLIHQERQWSDRIARLNPKQKTQCFWATTAQGLIILTKSGLAAKQVVQDCHLAPVETLSFINQFIKDGTASAIEKQIELGLQSEVNPKSLKACN